MRHQTLVLFFLVTSTSGCAHFSEPIQQPVYLTQEQFAEDIVRPISALVAAVGTYYKEQGEAPETTNALQEFSAKHDILLKQDKFDRLVLSRTAEGDLLLSADILARTVDDETTQARTSWLLRWVRAANGNHTQLAISPISPVCIKREPASKVVDQFLDLATAALSKTSISPYTCIQPTDASTQRKTIEMKNRMQRRLYQRLEEQKNQATTE